MYGLKPVPFVCSEIHEISHLKIEMWGTRISLRQTRSRSFVQDDKLPLDGSLRCLLEDNFVEWVLDYAGGAGGFELGDYFAHRGLFEDGVDGNPVGVAELGDGG